MKIEPGKYYRTRDGQKVGPMEESDHGDVGGFWGSGLYRKDGTFGYGSECYCHELDIVAEWTDAPARDQELTSPYGDGNHPLPPSTGTLAELKAKPGDVVEWIGYEHVGHHTLDFIDHDCYVFDTPEGPFTHTSDTYEFRIISRASTYDPEQEVDQLRNERDALQAVIDGAPKTWGEMTDAEKGALLLARHNGKAIQSHSTGMNVWYQHIGADFHDNFAYRIRPETNSETVTLYGAPSKNIQWCLEQCGLDTHRITFTTTDGEPDLDSITMERA